MPTPTGEQIIQDLLRPFSEAMEGQGITPLYLAKKLKRELNAKTSKTLKVKGAASKLPKGYKNVVTTGIIVDMGEGERDYSDGESVITWDEIDWVIQQRARIDAHKLRGDYPAEKKEISFNEDTLNAILTALPGEFAAGVREALIATISDKRG